MFIRKKKNKSGSISVQVISKTEGRYKVLKSLGASSDLKTLNKLEQKAQAWIKSYGRQKEIDFQSQQITAESVLDQIDELKQVGTSLLLEPIFNDIGFSAIEDPLFKLLVFSRLETPSSKRSTVTEWSLNKGIELSTETVYRYMDKLYNTQKELIQEISFKHSQKILGGNISVTFYDVTTLYFETDASDELRKTGFSKEGKHQHPQIVLGLLVSEEGYPMAYEIFEGSQFEGHTMLPVIERFCESYHLPPMIIVADSGLMSNKNIQELEDNGYQFILGARIKNSNQETKDKIFTLDLKEGQSFTIQQNNGSRLIITYSEKRAKKDLHNREKGLEKLKVKIKSGKLTKANINQRGYNKYLKMEGDLELSIDQEKFQKDAKWDGLKGYLTNTDLPVDEVLKNYSELWKIEKAFRISKTDLKIRPIYHRLERRIEAHICISFAAYKVYKELERLLKSKSASFSPEKAIKVAKTIYEIRVQLPNGKITKKTLILHEEQRYLASLFDF